MNMILKLLTSYIENATISNGTVGYYSISYSSWRETSRQSIERIISITETVTKRLNFALDVMRLLNDNEMQ